MAFPVTIVLQHLHFAANCNCNCNCNCTPPPPSDGDVTARGLDRALWTGLVYRYLNFTPIIQLFDKKNQWRHTLNKISGPFVSSAPKLLHTIHCKHQRPDPLPLTRAFVPLNSCGGITRQQDDRLPVKHRGLCAIFFSPNDLSLSNTTCKKTNSLSNSLQSTVIIYYSSDK